MELDVDLAQSQELETLEAIYGDDYEKLPGVWGRPVVSIKVKPAAVAEKDMFAAVTVLFHLSGSYPKTVPKIELRDRKGLSEKEQGELQEALEKRAASLVGEVMVYELTNMAEDFLTAHNRRPASIYEDMQRREKEKRRQREEAERKEAEAAKIEEEEKAAVAIAQRERFEQTVAEEMARRRERVTSRRDDTHRQQQHPHRQRQEDEEWEGVGGSDDDSSDGSGEFALRAGGGVSRYLTDFKELEKLGKGGSGQVVKVKNKLDKRFYAVKKIRLEGKEGALSSRLRREVTTISRLYHKNIVRYYQAWIELEEEEGGEGLTDGTTLTDSEDDDDGLSSEIGSPTATSGSSSSTAVTRGSGGMMMGGGSKGGAGGGRRRRRRPPTGRVIVEEEDEEDDDDDDDDDEEEWLAMRAPQPLLEPSVVIFGSEGGDEDHDDDDDGGVAPGAPKGAGDGEEEEEDEEEEEGGEEEGRGLMDLLGPSSQELSWSFSEGYEKVNSSTHREGGGGGAGRSNKRKWLFIQMEYCSQTLRDLIDTGQLWKSLPECWRLLRQMLEALVYIHRKGIVHRDIKPPNVFLDAEGNIKLGDFGLATVRSTVTTTSTAAASTRLNDEGLMLPPPPPLTSVFRQGSASGPPVSSSLHEEDHMGSESISHGMGTALYMAPEQGLAGARYDMKADMYSLGVLVFELFSPPFETMMERARTIGDLRTKGVLPADFLTRTPPTVHKVILQLVSANPSSRPSASQLLESGDMPGKMEVEEVYLKEALVTLMNPQSLSHGRLLSALFSHPNPPELDFTYDLEAVSFLQALPCRQLVLREHLCTVLRSVFHIHGALPVCPPILRPRPAASSTTTTTTATTSHHHNHHFQDLLDEEGNVLMLPSDLLTPFARYVAHTELRHCKRFEVGRVYRKREGGGHPGEEMQGQYDVICEARHAAPEILEAEAIWVASQVLANVTTSPILVRLNNVHLTPAILEVLEVPGEARAEVLRALEAACSAEGLSGKHLSLWLERLRPLLQHDRIREGVKGLLGAVAGCDRTDPLRTLEAVEGFLVGLPQIKAVLHQPEMAPSAGGGAGGGANSPLIFQQPPLLSRREHKRLRQACKVLSESLQGLRTLLGYLHALGVWPQQHYNSHNKANNSGGSKAGGGGEGGGDNHTSTGGRRQRSDSNVGLGLSPKDTGGGVGSGAVLMAGHARGRMSLEMQGAPRTMLLDLGLCRVKSHYQSGLVFQMVLVPKREEGTEAPSLLGANTGASSGGGGGSSSIHSGGSFVDDDKRGGGQVPANVTMRDDSISKHRGLRYQRYCVAEGGRYDSLILEHRSPAQWASPMVVAVGLTVAIDKLVYLTAPSSSGAGGGECPLVLDPRLTSMSPLLLASCPDVLICSTGSGLGPSGMTDRLLVASYLWTRGIRADYLPQDLWVAAPHQQPSQPGTYGSSSSSKGASRSAGGGGGGGGGGGLDPWSHHRSVSVDMSLEQLTRVCASLSVPFLVIIKAHTLRDHQTVKVRSVLDPTTSDVSVLLPQLARHIFDRLLHHRHSSSLHPGGLHVDSHHHHHHHHHHPFPSLHSPGDSSRGAPHPSTPGSSHHHHQPHGMGGGSGGGMEVSIISLDRGPSSSDKKKAFKEANALERRVRSHLESLLGPAVGQTSSSSSSSSSSSAQVVRVYVADVPYMVLRELGTAFLLHHSEGGGGVGGSLAALEEAMKPHGAYRKPLKLLADMLVQGAGEAEERGKKGGGSSSSHLVVVYSLQDDCWDVVPLHHHAAGGKKGGRGGGGGGGKAGGQQKR